MLKSRKSKSSSGGRSGKRLKLKGVKINPAVGADVQFVTGYTGEGSKKGPVTVIKFVDGDMLQFPPDVNYHFRRVAGRVHIVVKLGETVLAHIPHSEFGQVKYIAVNQWIFRDGDAR